MVESLKDKLEMTIEGDVTSYLGIEFKCLPSSAVQMLQLGLIERVLSTTGRQSCNLDHMPASQKPLGITKNGHEFAESWSYSSVICMLLYLAANSQPEITYTVLQCERFRHNPKVSHGNAVKRICHYLQGTKMKRMILCPLKNN